MRGAASGTRERTGSPIADLFTDLTDAQLLRYLRNRETRCLAFDPILDKPCTRRRRKDSMTCGSCAEAAFAR